MHWLLWIILANVSVLYLEWAYRVAKYPDFVQALPYIALPVLFTQLGLFYGFRLAPSLFLGATAFTLINTLARVCVVLYIGEKMLPVNWIGVLFVCVGVLLLKIK